MLVDDAYHLLIAIAAGNAQQSSKFADAIIHMHQEVTILHFLNLFHGESHLASTSTVALEIVFMETVEYLMVGKEASMKVVIDKSFMQSLVDRNEMNGRLRSFLLTGSIHVTIRSSSFIKDVS